jgi:hypothetical protein
MRIHLSGNANNEERMQITLLPAPIFPAIAVAVSMTTQAWLSI